MVMPLPMPPGLTVPPVDLKNIIDKTVEFVNKGGAAFEATIIQKGKDNPTFGFIKPGHPFHNYYKFKLAELKAATGGQAPATDIRVPEIPSQETQKPISAPSTVSKVAAPPPKLIKPTHVEPPPPLEFYLNLPNISAQELDIMRLTAQFVARNGQQFHHGLLNRENRNPQFDFLKHNHPLNIIFSALVNSYSKVLLPSRDTIEKLKSPIYRDKAAILERAVSHMEWEQTQERARKKAEEEEDQERKTIEPFDNETDLPAPATQEQLISGVVPAMPEVLEVNPVEEEEEMETDEMETEEAPAEATLAPQPAPVPVQAPASPPLAPEPELPPLPPPDTKLKILKEPIKRAEPKKNTMMMLCPRCNTMVPQDEYSEHMRIELLDPKFSEHKKQLEQRKKESMMVGTNDSFSNLSSLAKHRSDIFGATETDIGKVVGEEDKPVPEKVTWDGHSGSISRTTSAAMATHDQINTTQTSKAASDNRASIGPQGVHATPLPPPVATPARPPIITVVGGAAPSMPRPVIAPAVPATPLMSMPPGMPPGMPPMPGMPLPMPYGMPPMMPGMMPIPGMYAYGAPHGMHQPPPPEDEPNAKRQKMEELNLIPEAKFLADYPSPVDLIVQIPPPPGDKNEWNFQGQQLPMVLPPTATIADVKEKVKEALNMPPNKQKLKGPHISILKDDKTLAYYNVTPGTMLVLGVKERGGRKK